MTTTSLEQLFSVMDTLPGHRAVASEWRSHLGDATDDLTPFLRPTNEMAEAWECESPGGDGCPCRVVTHAPDDIVAVCQDSPRRRDPVPLKRTDLVVHRLDLDLFARSLARGLGLACNHVEPFPSAEGSRWLAGNAGAYRLGDRVFGSESIGFYLSLTDSPSTLAQLLPKVRRRDGANVAVVLVPHEGRARLHVHEVLDGSEIALLGLDRTASVGSGGRVAVDLADFILEKKFPDADPGDLLWPRYHLVMDPARDKYFYAGKRIEFAARAEIPKHLLLALAQEPEQRVSRHNLCAAAWPDEYGTAKTVEVDWNRRVRGNKATLSEALSRAAEGVTGVPRDPIAPVSSGSEHDGGYRLQVLPSRIAWWSRPDSM